MQKALLIKAALVGAIFLVLQIPLKMIDGIVAERSGRQQAVVQEISTSSYGRQVFAGPILSIPYVEEYEDTVTEDNARKARTRRTRRLAHFFPAVVANENCSPSQDWPPLEGRPGGYSKEKPLGCACPSIRVILSSRQFADATI